MNGTTVAGAGKVRWKSHRSMLEALTPREETTVPITENRLNQIEQYLDGRSGNTTDIAWELVAEVRRLREASEHEPDCRLNKGDSYCTCAFRRNDR